MSQMDRRMYHQPHLANRTEDWCQVNSWQSTSCHLNSIWLQVRRVISTQMMS